MIGWDAEKITSWMLGALWTDEDGDLFDGEEVDLTKLGEAFLEEIGWEEEAVPEVVWDAAFAATLQWDLEIGPDDLDDGDDDDCDYAAAEERLEEELDRDRDIADGLVPDGEEG